MRKVALTPTEISCPIFSSERHLAQLIVGPLERLARRLAFEWPDFYRFLRRDRQSGEREQNCDYDYRKMTIDFMHPETLILIDFSLRYSGQPLRPLR